MIKFDKPENLNGAELLAELAAGGVVANDQTSPFINGNGDFWLDINESDKAKATTIVAAHNGTMVAAVPTIADKLASVGLSIDDLKAALA
jgi:hypothetical protein